MSSPWRKSTSIGFVHVDQLLWSSVCFAASKARRRRLRVAGIAARAAFCWRRVVIVVRDI